MVTEDHTTKIVIFTLVKEKPTPPKKGGRGLGEARATMTQLFYHGTSIKQEEGEQIHITKRGHKSNCVVVHG